MGSQIQEALIMDTPRKGKWRTLGSAALAALLFSILRRIDIILPIGDLLAEKGWPLTPILAVMILVRMAFSAAAVLLVLPPILGFLRLSEWLPETLRGDSKTVLLGIVSYIVFGVLATMISLSMGIYRGDWSTVLARPDIRPDPDVIGWGYFLLALVPSVWEELAFRGLILPRLQKSYSTWVSVLLSTLLFSLFHLTNLATQAPGTAIGGVVMSFFFGLAWGVMTIRTQSVLPAMISHYLVDSIGQPFLNVDGSDPAQATLFFLLLTLTFPIVNIALTRIVIPKEVDVDSGPIGQNHDRPAQT
jgi:membrane protease YdiL (CAAX protease family)